MPAIFKVLAICAGHPAGHGVFITTQNRADNEIGFYHYTRIVSDSILHAPESSMK